jgi:iron complex outermembrane receptor protein
VRTFARRLAVSIVSLPVAVSAASLRASVARAQDSSAKSLPPVVTVTRDPGSSPLDLPFAISSLRPDSIAPGQAHLFVAQTLSLIPGVTVADRTNPSQDTRISIRGYGARAQFGVRSIRILRDELPLTLPDGQTPLDYLDLESVGRVEVIRGPSAALYGNGAGGVIDLHSVAPPDVPLAVQERSWVGSDETRRFVGLFGGVAGPATYEGNIGHTTTDGFRAYSKQEITNGFARATANAGATRFALEILGANEPTAQNPGAITRAQFDSAPRSADPAQVAKRSRKRVSQELVGLSADRPLAGGGELFAQVYGGARDLYNPQTFAVVDVDRRQGGGGVRGTFPWTAFGLSNRFTVGADAQWVNDHRFNWANCDGVTATSSTCPTVGPEEGALSLDQNEIVSSVGPYLRDELRAGPFRAALGLRDDEVRFQLDDHYFGDGRDDSGAETMRALSPLAGLAWRLSPLHSLYANVGSAFETPTTTELGNHPDGSAGLNPDLKPALSTTYETGAKGLAVGRLRYDVALFDTEVRDELIPYEVPNGAGRTYYLNAGRTRRAGVEGQVGTDVGPVSLVASYAYSHFRFVDFLNGATQYAGNRIPGIPEHQLQADATWHLRNAFVVLEGQSKSRVYVDDANDAAAPAFAVFDARVGATEAFGRPWLSPVIGVQNLFDARYVASVAINASGPSVAATKYYEPGAGRVWLIGLSAATNAW